jgi:hypothetical protein
MQFESTAIELCGDVVEPLGAEDEAPLAPSRSGQTRPHRTP